MCVVCARLVFVCVCVYIKEAIRIVILCCTASPKKTEMELWYMYPNTWYFLSRWLVSVDHTSTHVPAHEFSSEHTDTYTCARTHTCSCCSVVLGRPAGHFHVTVAGRWVRKQSVGWFVRTEVHLNGEILIFWLPDTALTQWLALYH